jgi:hypothetical protein
MQKAGYIPVASFILPENCWTEHYYQPQVAVCFTSGRRLEKILQ